MRTTTTARPRFTPIAAALLVTLLALGGVLTAWAANPSGSSEVFPHGSSCRWYWSSSFTASTGHDGYVRTHQHPSGCFAALYLDWCFRDSNLNYQCGNNGWLGVTTNAKSWPWWTNHATGSHQGVNSSWEYTSIRYTSAW